jgi:hypothetical protein
MLANVFLQIRSSIRSIPNILFYKRNVCRRLWQGLHSSIKRKTLDAREMTTKIYFKIYITGYSTRNKKVVWCGNIAYHIPPITSLRSDTNKWKGRFIKNKRVHLCSETKVYTVFKPGKTDHPFFTMARGIPTARECQPPRTSRSASSATTATR